MNNSADFIARKIYFHWLLRSKVANDVGRQNSFVVQVDGTENCEVFIVDASSADKFYGI